MSSCSDWQHISTCPIGRPVELGAFPVGEHEPNITICTSVEGLRLAYPKATHWRELAAGSVRAAAAPRQ